ncbi:hypothetical protein DRE_03334 [Drechslerella stenobrocha 248]|uniref:Uncharacterized protein n=1 Tax=Drechslerella stenobrocha 248 TaxID=1043628 RepID=W7IDZ5_9PEZI|nr:hypothetical protein DRE_03334 [Drechslerella stenobrocha 248]
MDKFLPLLGDEIGDPDEECFLLLSNKPDNRDLGFVDRTRPTIPVSINSQDFLIHQSPSLLTSARGAGTTGAVLWKVTPLLAGWLTHPSNVFASRILRPTSTVVELGAGTSGVLALSLAPLVAGYIATDQQYCLKLLRKNISENSGDRQADPPTSSRAKAAGNPDKRSKRATENARRKEKITVLPLDWQLTQATSIPELQDKGIDLIIAADCIYNESLVQPLVDTMADLSGLGRTGEHRPDRPAPFVMVAQELRSPDVLEAFMAAFCSKFTVWRLPDALYEGCGDSGRELMDGGGYVVHLGILK